MRAGDIFAAVAGGRWLGDPLERDPAAVHRDFLNNLVSRESATHIYGVVLNETAFDTEQTLALRDSIRAVRIRGRSRAADCPPHAHVLSEIGPALKLMRVGSEIHIVSRAGATLARGSTRWRDGAIRDSLKLPPQLRLHQDLEISCYYCRFRRTAIGRRT